MAGHSVTANLLMLVFLVGGVIWGIAARAGQGILLSLLAIPVGIMLGSYAVVRRILGR